jgi:MYXO-CTERM domain-containing protein
MAGTRLRAIGKLLILFACCVRAAPAGARAPLADEIAALLSLSYVPACSLCHSAGDPAGPVNTPFGTAMRVRGLSASADSVAPALEALARDHADSDGDGVGDVEELRAATNPNPDAQGCDCSATRASGAAPIGLFLSLLVARGRRRFRRARDARAN